MEYYSAIKRNAFESVLTRWMNLELITHSEESQKEKEKYCILMHTILIFLFVIYFMLYIGSRFIHLIRTDSNAFLFISE